MPAVQPPAPSNAGAPPPVSPSKPRPARRAPAPPAAGDAVADTGAQQQAEVQLALAAQAARFDAMMKVLAEQQREINAIIDFGMAQAKRDDQLMNEWIRLI